MIEQFIELVKSTTKWSGRFDRRQYVTVVIGVNLIGMGFLLGIALVVDIMPVVESGVFIELLVMMFSLAWCVAAVIVSVGTGVRRFYDLDLYG